MIPYSRPKLSDLYTLSQSKLLVTPAYTSQRPIPIWPIYGSTLSPPPRDLSRALVKDENLFFIMTGI